MCVCVCVFFLDFHKDLLATPATPVFLEVDYSNDGRLIATGGLKANQFDKIPQIWLAI